MSDFLDLTPRLRGPANRKATRVEIRGPLTEDDLRALAAEPNRALAVPAVQKLRDSHHRLARCIASGMNYTSAGHQAGYSQNRVALLMQDPSFKDLVEVYRKANLEVFSEYTDIAMSNLLRGERLVEDALEAAGDREEPLTLGELRPVLDLISDRADRLGYPKHAVGHSVNHDLAARLEAGRRRAKLIDAPSEGGLPLASGEEPVEDES